MKPFGRIARSSSALAGTPAGVNMKPTFDGTFKEAGAPLEKYVLEHENGAKALVDTKTATCVSWVDQNGVQVIGGPHNAHFFPDVNTQLKGEFYPEERAKKMSFDRMIFKAHDDGIEYRVDVTLRENCLEYDVVIINEKPEAKDVSMALKLNISPDAASKGAKIVAKKGYTESTDNTASTGKWTVPVGKFKETKFYIKVDSTKK